MKVILTETLDKVGKVGQVVNVKNGFARNYLIPKNYAIIATKLNLKRIEAIEAEARAKADKKNEEYRQSAAKISNLQAVFSKRADSEGKLFGSVSESDILSYLTEKGILISKSQIKLDKHIKHVGASVVRISFTSEIFADLKVKVEDSDTKAVDTE